MNFATDLGAALEIEELDRDLYRAVNTVDAQNRPRLYGGQVAAQALKAAGLTVPEGRHAHSMHGYFLRPGLVDRPVILKVDQDRDGGSFSARRAVAVQDGEVIFNMLASFHLDKPGPDYDAELASTGQPLEAPAPEVIAKHRDHGMLDIREITESREVAGKQFHTDRMWIRVVHPVPQDRLSSACALTYLSDMSSGFGQLDVPGLATAGPSIDHAMWFHHPVDTNGWLLMELWPWKAAGQRGVYLGSVRDRNGVLAATLSQEAMLRAD